MHNNLVLNLCTFLLITILFGCNTVNVKHINNSENISQEKLSMIYFQENEVVPISIDGVPFEGKKGEWYFIKSGFHKITVGLKYENTILIENIPITSTVNSEYVRSVCLDFSPKDGYVFSASDSTENWQVETFKYLNLLSPGTNLVDIKSTLCK